MKPNKRNQSSSSKENHPLQSRRGFLKSSTVTASAAALGALDMTRFAHAGGSDVIKVGMIGCGGRNSGAAAQALTADTGARLVAMCDIFRDRVDEKRSLIARKCPGQVEVDDDHCFTGLEGYKDVIDCSDVVLIANAAKFHPLHTMASVQAGKHVFVEKPHGIDPAGIHMIEAACKVAQKKSLCVVSGLHSRYHPGYAETIQRIHDGAIGDVVSIEENFLRSPYQIIDRAPGLSELEWQLSTQYHFTWLSGDDVVQSLVHNLDRTSWVLQGQAPVKCHGLGGRSSMTAPIYGDVFDHHSVVYQYANGVKVYAFCRTTTGCYNEGSSLIRGTKGKASVLNCSIQGENPWRWKGSVNPYQIEHDKLFAAVRCGEPINNGDYMARSTLTTIMGQISCYTGKEVTWEEITQSRFHYSPKPEDCHDGMEPPTKPGPSGSYPVPVPGKTALL